MSDVHVALLLTYALITLFVEGALTAIFTLKAYKRFEQTVMSEAINKRTISIMISVLACWQLKYDFLQVIVNSGATEITTTWTWTGVILTGLAVSRGSNGLSDFFERRKLMKDAFVQKHIEDVIK